jgi:hypothetical protein
MAVKLAGTLSFDLNGRIASIGASCTVQAQRAVNEGKVGQSGRGGFIERPSIPFIEAELLTDDVEMEDYLAGLTNGTVQIDLANGESWVFNNAYAAGERPADAVEGTRTIRIECMPQDLDRNF